MSKAKFKSKHRIGDSVLFNPVPEQAQPGFLAEVTGVTFIDRKVFYDLGFVDELDEPAGEIVQCVDSVFVHSVPLQ